MSRQLTEQGFRCVWNRLIYLSNTSAKLNMLSPPSFKASSNRKYTMYDRVYGNCPVNNTRCTLYVRICVFTRTTCKETTSTATHGAQHKYAFEPKNAMLYSIMLYSMCVALITQSSRPSLSYTKAIQNTYPDLAA